MYKIAHISDLHFNGHNESHKEKLVKLIWDIINRNCDHIAITGDITDNADEKDYNALREIFQHFNILSKEKLTLIPGNHDIFGSEKVEGGVFLYPSICKKVNFTEKVHFFYQNFKETFNELEIDDDEYIFPCFKIINNIALISINSVAEWSMERNPKGTNGNVSDRRFLKLKEILLLNEFEHKFKIVLIHHHFNKPVLDSNNIEHSLWLYIERYRMKLYNKDRLFKLFNESEVNLVLHGHTHISNEYKRRGINFINSSACFHPFSLDKNLKYHIINIYSQNNTITNYNTELITLS